MKKFLYISLFILLSLFVSSCQGSRISDLEATNEALSNQLNTLMSQLTQQANPPIQTNQESASATTATAVPIEPTPASPSPIPMEVPGVIAPTLIFSGSGAITPFSNHKVVPSNIFGAANVHLICNANDASDGKIWIDTKEMSVSCSPNSESWLTWKQDISVGDHYIYSQNDNDQYEFWTVGTTPFTIQNKYSHSDYIFMINNPGIYNLSADLIKGAFNLYLTCQGAQNFNYQITESTTIPVVLNPAQCELLIRDEPPGTLYPGEIVVGLEFVK
jgi:hypothetical protein